MISTTSGATARHLTDGPPGQTRLANLAPLCRTYHRLTNHAGWHYARLDHKQHLWTTPAGDLIAVRTRRRRT